MRVLAAAAGILAILGFSMPCFAAAFAKGPYLQALGATSVTFKFELDAPAPSLVSVVDPATQKTFTQSGPAADMQAIRVEGLTPATSYDYVVTAGEGAAAHKSETGHFTTAPIDDRPIHFLVYGDSRSDDASHAAVLRAMSQRPADFLVATGDMVERGSNAPEWESFFRVEGATLRDHCVFAAIGNHELAGDSAAAAFLRYFAPDPSAAPGAQHLYGTFRWGNTRFFLLNAMDEWSGPERVWLEDVLGKAMDEPGLMHRIAVLHHGPFSSGPHQGNQRLGTVVQIMRERKVDLILAGHDHIYERGEGAGIKYIISGGAGAPLYAREHEAPQTQAFESVHHFVEVAIEGERVSIVARRAVGSVIEACSFAAGSPWSCDASAKVDRPKSAPAAAASPVSPSTRQACGCEAPGESPLSSSWGSIGAAAIVLLAAERRRKRP